MNEQAINKLLWIIRYLLEEDFSAGHLDALATIVGLFNDCQESEKEIFEFADRLHHKYAR